MPPLIMMSSCVIVDDQPKIKCEDPTVDDDVISFKNFDLCIPL